MSVDTQQLVEGRTHERLPGGQHDQQGTAIGNLEVRLKLLALGLSVVHDQEGAIEKLHKLGPLWRRVRAALMQAFPNEDARELLVIDDHIAEFDLVDPTSYSFRYAVDLQGKSALPSDLTHIGYVELAAAIELVAPLLEGISAAVGNAADYVRESRANAG